MQKPEIARTIAKAKARLTPQVRPKPPAPTGKKPAKKKSEKDAFIWAEGEQESGGDYHAVNANSGALGKWQVMPANLPGWLAESGLPSMTDQEYLDSQTAQNTLALHILGGDYDKWGPRGAAAVWYSGQPNWKATYGSPPVYQYVDDVVALMAHYPGGGFKVSAGGTPSPGKGITVISGKVPAPGKDDWSVSVRQATMHVSDLGNSVHNHTVTLSRLAVRK